MSEGTSMLKEVRRCKCPGAFFAWLQAKGKRPTHPKKKP